MKLDSIMARSSAGPLSVDLALTRPAHLVVAALLALAILAPAIHVMTAPPRVVVVPVWRGPAVQAVYATGAVEASVTVRVAPQVGGRLVELGADEGSVVKAGQVLARLDDSELRATVAELQAKAVYAAQHHERTSTLHKQGWTTQQKLEQARADMTAAEMAARRAAAQMAYSTLTAPSDGVVIRRDGEIGDTLPVNQTVFHLARSGAPLRVVCDVDEEDIPLVKPGQLALIRTDAFPAAVIHGTVKEITPKGDQIARSYRVRIELLADTALMIGMSAEVNIITEEKKDALLVPTAAVTASNVWVVRSGQLTRVPVQVAVKGRDDSAVTGAISEGDLVLLEPTAQLREGTRVTTRIENKGPPGGAAP